jgi:hypothetical protein
MRVVDGELPLESFTKGVGTTDDRTGRPAAAFDATWNTTGSLTSYIDARPSAAAVAEAFGPAGLQVFDAADARMQERMVVDARLATFAMVSSGIFSLED